MRSHDIIPAAFLACLAATPLHADEPAAPARSAVHNAASRRTYLRPHPERDTLTDHWFGLGEDLDEIGITTTLDLWITFQAAVTGGLDTDADVTGLYFWDTHVDLDRMLGLNGASIFTRVEGGWGSGINDSVGAIMNVNGAQDEDHAVGLTHLWLEQRLLDDRLKLRIGKMDPSFDAFEFHGMSVAFDAIPYANNGRGQFLDGGLVNNAAIAFAQSGLGAMVLVEPVERLYVAGVVTTSNTNRFALEIDTVFNGDAEWLFMAETGVAVEVGGEALPGLYYAGYWHSGFDDAPSGQGVYFGASQLLHREPGTKQQGLGVFARYGYGDDNPAGIRHFWSVGGQYEGPFPGRDRDVVGLGWAQAFTTGSSLSASYEGVLELYYRARLTPWLHVSPSLQYIVNPGSNDISDALTLGVRAQITF